MKAISYLRVGLATSVNVVLYAATSGRFLWLEGRVHRGVFRNWSAVPVRPERVPAPDQSG